MSNHIPTYKCWHAMIARCHNPSSPSYNLYGGRGITVDARWRSYANFLADMGEKPKGLSIERVDNNAGYCKINCKWATLKEQNNNKRTCVLLTYQGRTLNVTEWAELLNIPRVTLFQRIRRYGRNAEKVLSRDNGREQLITLEEERVSVSEAARRTGINRSTLQRRFENFGDNPTKLYQGTRRYA